MSLSRLALSESFERVPETCPRVLEESTRLSFKFDRWLDQRFADKLTEGERNEISKAKDELLADFFEASKQHGVLLLRRALAKEIELNFRLSMSPERVAHIEQGGDPEVQP